MDEFCPFLSEDEELVNQPINIEQELDNFRQQWRCELVKERKGADLQNSNDGGEGESASLEEPSIEEQAKFLFLQGVAAERRHQLAEAIRYYRRAVQLVPDIEFRIEEYPRPKRERKERTVSECSIESSGAPADEEEDLSDLLQHFHKLHVTDGPLCNQQFERPGTSLSSLPVEVINYILKWLVSSDLDVAALENASKVCRGLFVASRDEELWRLICQRVWGMNCGDIGSFGNYRNMYYLRPHLRLNGCYINKTVYYRQGENSFDSFYRPFHLVEYYRYVRFYPEGHVLMMTTADNPYETVQKLKKHCKLQGVLYGWYRLVGNVVSLVLKRRKTDYNQTSYGRYKRKNRREEDELEETFHVEFDLENAGSRMHSKLQWKHYSRIAKNKKKQEESVTEFDITPNSFPPMIFSRVKSYTQSSENPLQ